MPAMAVDIEHVPATHLPPGYEFTRTGLAGIYCVATLPEERAEGPAAHLTAEALRRAQRLGYRVGILQSSAPGHSVYLRLGFEDLATVPNFVRMPA